MRFKDEKEMWYADTEHLAAKLADKSQKEIQEILDDRDVIKLRSCERSSISFLGRLSSIVVFPSLIILMAVKWLVSGDRYLDSWAKKYKFLNSIINFSGIK